MSKSRHGKHVASLQWKIVRHLHKGEAISAGLARSLAALLGRVRHGGNGELGEFEPKCAGKLEINARVVFPSAEWV